MEKQTNFKNWFTENLWGILGFIGMVVVSWTIISTGVEANEDDITRNSDIVEMHVIRIDKQLNEQKDIDSTILQELREISAKLDLILDGKIKLD